MYDSQGCLTDALVLRQRFWMLFQFSFQIFFVCDYMSKFPLPQSECYCFFIVLAAIQCVPGGNVNILGDHSIGHSKKKEYMNVFPIPNGFRDRAI
jgi:hypothetical protein